MKKMEETIELKFKTLPDGRLHILIKHGEERAALTSATPIVGVPREEKRRTLDLTETVLADCIRRKLFPQDTLQFQKNGNVWECLGYPDQTLMK